MPSTVIIATPPPLWDRDVEWPYRYNQLAGADVTPLTQPLAGMAGWVQSNPGIFGGLPNQVNVGGTGVVQTQGYRDGMWTLEATVSNLAVPFVKGYGQGLNFIPSLTRAAFAPGASSPQSRRASWLTVTFQRANPCAWTEASGFGIVNSPAALGAQNWPGATNPAIANGGGFIVCGDGANGLQFIGFDDTTPNPAVQLVQAPLIGSAANVGLWETIEFFITGASPSRAATLDVYYNNGLVIGGLEFTNAPGGLSWNAAAEVGNFQYRINDAGSGAAASRVRVAYWRLRFGAYTRDGAPLGD